MKHVVITDHFSSSISVLNVVCLKSSFHGKMARSAGKTLVWGHGSDCTSIKDETVQSNKHSDLTSTYQTGWSYGNALNLYLGGGQFKAQLGNQLS
jgi:hypothetical protein